MKANLGLILSLMLLGFSSHGLSSENQEQSPAQEYATFLKIAPGEVARVKAAEAELEKFKLQYHQTVLSILTDPELSGHKAFSNLSQNSVSPQEIIRQAAEELRNYLMTVQASRKARIDLAMDPVIQAAFDELDFCATKMLTLLLQTLKANSGVSYSEGELASILERFKVEGVDSSNLVVKFQGLIKDRLDSYTRKYPTIPDQNKSLVSWIESLSKVQN